MYRTVGLTALICASLALGARAPSVAHAEESAAQLQLRHRMEALQASGRLTVDGVRITAVRLIAELYPQGHFQPVWTDPKQVDELLRAITDIRSDGLDSQVYYFDRLERLRAELATHPT